MAGSGAKPGEADGNATAHGSARLVPALVAHPEHGTAVPGSEVRNVPSLEEDAGLAVPRHEDQAFESAGAALESGTVG